jgi:hypothetical protein
MNKCLGATLLIAALCCPTLGNAEEESVMIGAILEDVEAYHLRMVTMKGTVRDVRERGPYQLPNGTACYGAYTFLLEDDSGMLEVAVVGICGRPALRSPGGWTCRCAGTAGRSIALRCGQTASRRPEPAAPLR